MFTRTRTALATAAALALGLAGTLAATSAASAAPSASTASASTAAIGRCTTASLAAWVNLSQGSVAAGTTSWPLDLTNTSSHACTVDGYPAVAATNASGGQLGRAADHWPLYDASTVTIPAGGTAHAYLFWLQVANFPAGCDATTASLLRVVPPGRTSAAETFFSMQACRSTKPLYQYLWVSAIRSGVGRAL